MDTGKDGELDIYEVDKAFKRLDIALNPSQLKILFSTIDHDQSGYIS